MNKNLSFDWTILGMVYHSKGNPRQSPFGPFRNRKQGIVSVPFRTNTDPMPTIYRLHKTDQFRTVGKCTGIQWHPRHFSASNMGSIQCLSAYTAHRSMYPSVFTQYELNDPL